MISTFSRVFSGFVLAGAAGLSMAGPVILGGDDLTDHGSRSGGANLAGWLYIEKAVGNVLGGVTRAGALTTDIVALGSVANPSFSTFNAGGAIGSVGNVLGKSVLYIDGAAAINQFFLDLAGGARSIIAERDWERQSGEWSRLGMAGNFHSRDAVFERDLVRR